MDTSVEYIPTSFEKVANYRYEQMLRAGFSEVNASILCLRRDVDLHHACDLIADGCDPQLAFEILY
jgi:hypothetical protein